MTDADVERFYALVEARFHFLAAHGFRKAPNDDRATPVSASVAYLGSHVGFLIMLDRRDAVVDIRVVRVRDGKLVETGNGGYSRDLYSHLVAHAGYRGGVWSRRAGEAPESERDRIEHMVDDWAKLLEAEGRALLQDGVRALPQ